MTSLDHLQTVLSSLFVQKYPIFQAEDKLVKSKGNQAKPKGVKRKIVNFSANLIKTHKAAEEDYEDFESSIDENQPNGNGLTTAQPEVIIGLSIYRLLSLKIWIYAP